MRYIGSKEKLNEWIFSIIFKDTKPDGLTFLDGCAGSGSVSKYAAKLGFAKIVSNSPRLDSIRSQRSEGRQSTVLLSNT